MRGKASITNENSPKSEISTLAKLMHRDVLHQNM